MFHLALFVVLLSLKSIIGLYCNLQFANNENNGIHTRIIHFKISNSLTVIYLANNTSYIYYYNDVVDNVETKYQLKYKE